MISRRHSLGFTLLEVIIAMAIMVVAFGAILTSQGGAIQRTIRTKEMNIAGWIAHREMVNAEHVLAGKSFSEMSKEEPKDAPAPFQRYKIKREVRELDLPDLAPPKKEDQAIPDTVRILMKSITKYLNSSMRELVITVSWKQGAREQSVKLATYLVDLNTEFKIEL